MESCRDRSEAGVDASVSALPPFEPGRVSLDNPKDLIAVQEADEDMAFAVDVEVVFGVVWAVRFRADDDGRRTVSWVLQIPQHPFPLHDVTGLERLRRYIATVSALQVLEIIILIRVLGVELFLFTLLTHEVRIRIGAFSFDRLDRPLICHYARSDFLLNELPDGVDHRKCRARATGFSFLARRLREGSGTTARRQRSFRLRNAHACAG